jgi:urease accessory protein
MLIREKKEYTGLEKFTNKIIERLPVEWFETNKRILHKKTYSGIPVTLQFLNNNPDLKDGDILFENDKKVIIVEILPCSCIVVQPENIQQAAALCYEIGNRHLPLFFEENTLLVPTETPLFHLLEASGFRPVIEERKLTQPFKTTVLPNVQLSDTGTHLKKIVDISNSG